MKMRFVMISAETHADLAQDVTEAAAWVVQLCVDQATATVGLHCTCVKVGMNVSNA